MKFMIEDRVFDLFPNLHIGILSVRNITNMDKGREDLLEKACCRLRNNLAENSQINQNIEIYQDAMKKFKRKKGVKSSIYSLVNRVSKGQEIKSINPAVDIYNSISLNYIFPCGGADKDKIEGDYSLMFASGIEEFIALGDTNNKPPRPDELIYKDNHGAVVRSWLWRESDRTKITNKTTNVLLYLELLDINRKEDFLLALDELENLICNELGGISETNMLNIKNKECIIT
ncbi:hypothetical protein EZV73_09555 [Acidaminobacter sp. JC074]|uniref:B3/B4 domain-containing protein n=1 Tax=Acidaminobacter sp. JC074 TaxID=2530199 RepID=UPI001F0D8078|nr:phenylalanine--tRNA ligase beta subunit-related protein [Acidaminobacter sp. JC074]MCH4887819.1 hypothetical protein [Acidaminobacter sp. JC074]